MTDNTPRSSEHSEPMSTTDKLAAALRNARGALVVHGDEDECEECVATMAAADKALAEYDATPAGEVTADAVEVARTKLGSYAKYIGTKELQAALAAALPGLMQDKARLDFLDAKRAAFIGGYGLRCQSFRDDIDKEIRDAATAQVKQAEGGK